MTESSGQIRPVISAAARFTGKLTPRLREEACNAVRHGTPATVALKKLGLTPKTVWNWQQWAESGEKGPKYEQLFVALHQAWAEWQSHVAGQLPAAIQKDARMAVEVASRIMPDEYGRRDQVDVNVQIDAGPTLKLLAEAQQKMLSGEYRILEDEV